METTVETARPGSGHGGTGPIGGRARTVALVVILVAAFMDLIDATVLNVALPSIQRRLGASPGQVPWLLAGYTLALALLLITGARLGDRWGRRRAFCLGVGGFTVASALCGLAADPAALIATRVVQGAFAALMVPQVMTQIQVMYAPAERGGPMAAFAAMTGLAATVGPVLGAVLTSATLPLGGALAGLADGWRLVFWVNVPVGVAALLLAYRLLPETRAPRAEGFDLAGLGLSTAGLLLVLAPLGLGGPAGPPAWAAGPVAAGVATLAAFVAHQRRRDKRGRPVLLRTALFRFGSLRHGLATQALYFAAVLGFFLVFALYLQDGVRRSPLAAGLIMLPWSVTVAVAATLASTLLLARLGRATVRLGLAGTAAGLAWLAVVAVRAEPGYPWWWLLPGLVVGAAGMGLVVAPLAQFTLADVPAADAGSGSALFNTTAQLAASVGVTVLGTLFAATVAAHPHGVAGGTGAGLAVALTGAIVLVAAALATTAGLPRHPSAPAARADPAGTVGS